MSGEKGIYLIKKKCENTKKLSVKEKIQKKLTKSCQKMECKGYSVFVLNVSTKIENKRYRH